MRKFNWKTKSLTLAMVLLLLLATNPELRALLLVFDFLGAELLVLLLLGYARRLVPLVGSYLRSTLVFLALITKAARYATRWFGFVLFPSDGLRSQLDHLAIATGVLLRIAVGRLSVRDVA